MIGPGVHTAIVVGSPGAYVVRTDARGAWQVLGWFPESAAADAWRRSLAGAAGGAAPADDPNAASTDIEILAGPPVATPGLAPAEAAPPEPADRFPPAPADATAEASAPPKPRRRSGPPPGTVSSKFTDQQIEVVRTLWPTPASAAEIAAKAGVEREQVFTLRKRLGLPARKAGFSAAARNAARAAAAGPALSDEVADAIRTMWLAGEPTEAIGDAVGHKADWVKKRAKDLGLPVRGPGWNKRAQRAAREASNELTPTKEATLRRLWADDRPIAVIATELRMKPDVVSSHRKALGLPARGPGWAAKKTALQARTAATVMPANADEVVVFLQSMDVVVVRHGKDRWLLNGRDSVDRSGLVERANRWRERRNLPAFPVPVRDAGAADTAAN